MIAIAAGPSVSIYSIILPSDYTTLPPVSSILLGKINEFMRTHVVNLSENNIRKVENMAHEAMVADIILNGGCEWKVVLLWGNVFDIFGHINHKRIIQNISQINNSYKDI